MSIQITVRLSETTVAHIDAAVSAGRAKSRAAYIDRYMAREAMRQRGKEDLEKIIAAGPDPELEAIAAWTSAHPVDMSDLD